MLRITACIGVVLWGWVARLHSLPSNSTLAVGIASYSSEPSSHSRCNQSGTLEGTYWKAAQC